jgi:hypothetical protein
MTAGWMDGWMGGGKDGWMVGRCMGEWWTDGCMSGWMDYGWVDR